MGSAAVIDQSEWDRLEMSVAMAAAKQDWQQPFPDHQEKVVDAAAGLVDTTYTPLLTKNEYWPANTHEGQTEGRRPEVASTQWPGARPRTPR